MTYPTRAALLAENEMLRAEILALRAGIEGMDQVEAQRLRVAVQEAGGRRNIAELQERIARRRAAAYRAAMLAMLSDDPLGDEFKAEQRAR